MDANGNNIWRRYFGGTQADLNKDVIETDDGGFLLIGVSDSPDFDISNAIGADDFWVIKVSAIGEKVWEHSYGGLETDRAFSVTRANDGNFILAGESRSLGQDVSNPKGGGDIWIVKINASNGSILWEQSFGGTEFDTSRGIKKWTMDHLQSQEVQEALTWMLAIIMELMMRGYLLLIATEL